MVPVRHGMFSIFGAAVFAWMLCASGYGQLSDADADAGSAGTAAGQPVVISKAPKGMFTPAAMKTATVEQADAAFSQGRYQEALAYYRQVAQLQPGNAHVRSRLIELQAKMQKGQGASSAASVPQSPTPATAGSQQASSAADSAEAAFSAGKYEEALPLYQEALKQHPASAQIRARILECQSKVRGDKEPNATKASTTAAASSKSSEKEQASEAAEGAGVTTYTAHMPTDKNALLQLRQKYLGRPEFRGAWITRMDWASKDGAQIKQNIVKLMETARLNGFNAVFFQVRGDCSTLYPSKIEPWSHRVGGQDPGFDPLQLAIQEAHKRGLELHAYINPGIVTESPKAVSNPNHVLLKHCTAQSNPNWLVYKASGPAELNDGYVWLNLNLPEVQTYLRSVVMDLVTRYDLDGIHYDRIRFQAPDVSQDPWSKARYQIANPEKLEYNDWQTANITRMLTDMYACIAAIRPKTKVSAAVWGIYNKNRLPGYSWTSTGLQDYHQDSIGWINEGCVDALVPMIYWEMGGKKPDYDELLADFLSQVTNGRHIYGGQKVFNAEESLRQTVASNLIGAQGTSPFTLMELNKFGILDLYRSGIYPDRVQTPPMPWKSAPEKGIVMVAVKDAHGAPVVDAQVTLAGSKHVGLSSADGFCAFIDAVPANGAVVTAQKAGAGKGASAPVNVTPGKPILAEIVLR